MKRFTVPADIQLRDPYTKAEVDKPVSFAGFAAKAWLNDERLGTSIVALHKLRRYVDRLLDAKAGDVIELEDADHEVLAVVVREPKAFFGTAYALQLLPFSEAVLDARTEVTNGISAHDAAASQPAHVGTTAD